MKEVSALNYGFSWLRGRNVYQGSAIRRLFRAPPFLNVARRCESYQALDARISLTLYRFSLFLITLSSRPSRNFSTPGTNQLSLQDPIGSRDQPLNFACFRIFLGIPPDLGCSKSVDRSWMKLALGFDHQNKFATYKLQAPGHCFLRSPCHVPVPSPIPSASLFQESSVPEDRIRKKKSEESTSRS